MTTPVEPTRFMEPPSSGEQRPGSRLEEISTRWSQVGDPLQFVMRYGPAIEKYLAALIGDRDAAADVSQEFLIRMMQHRFASASPEEGRFRQYLKTSVRNAARMYFRRKNSQKDVNVDADWLLEQPDRETHADAEWLAEWRRCVLDRTWAALHRQQQSTPGSLGYSVMRIAFDFGEQEDSTALARRLSTSLGRDVRPDAFRKQLSRARRLFAELLVSEVARTLQDPTPEDVESELAETGLMPFIRSYLPPDWTDWVRSL